MFKSTPCTLEKIENVKTPIINETYLVKCVRSTLEYEIGEFKNWVPVFGELHDDKGIALEENHFHTDYRFIPWKYIEEQERLYKVWGWYNEQRSLYQVWGKSEQDCRTFTYVAITEKMIKEQINCDLGNNQNLDEIKIIEGEHIKYLPMQYLRHFDFMPEYSFFNLYEIYKKKDIRMKNMICPHKRANLKSCKVVEGIVECPCHGLKWDVNTGKLADQPHPHVSRR